MSINNVNFSNYHVLIHYISKSVLIRRTKLPSARVSQRLNEELQMFFKKLLPNVLSHVFTTSFYLQIK